MHLYEQGGYACAATGGTFGNTTSAPNFEPFARARAGVSQHLWHHPDLLKMAAPFTPQPKFTPRPFACEIEKFQQADSDSINQGVLDSNGKRRAPPYGTHVDDCMYGDVYKQMSRTIAASQMGAYSVLGFPDNRQPDAISQDKLITSQHTAPPVKLWAAISSPGPLPLACQKKNERSLSTPFTPFGSDPTRGNATCWKSQS
jgi:hypothetical protein